LPLIDPYPQWITSIALRFALDQTPGATQPEPPDLIQIMVRRALPIHKAGAGIRKDAMS
jgi:hypothetical protein